MNRNKCQCPTWDAEAFDGPQDYASACANCPVHGSSVKL